MTFYINFLCFFGISLEVRIMSHILQFVRPGQFGGGAGSIRFSLLASQEVTSMVTVHGLDP